MAKTLNNWRYGASLGFLLHPTTWYHRTFGGQEPSHDFNAPTGRHGSESPDHFMGYIEEALPEAPTIVEAVEPTEVTIQNQSVTAKSLLSIATGSSAYLPLVVMTCLLLLLALWYISRAYRRAEPQRKEHTAPTTTSKGMQTPESPAHNTVPPPAAPSEPLPLADPPPENKMSGIVTLIDTPAFTPENQTSEDVRFISTQVPPPKNQMSGPVTLIDIPPVRNRTTPRTVGLKAINASSSSSKASLPAVPAIDTPKETPLKNPRMRDSKLFQRARR